MNDDEQSLLFCPILDAESAAASAVNTPEDAYGHASPTARTSTDDEINNDDADDASHRRDAESDDLKDAVFVVFDATAAADDHCDNDEVRTDVVADVVSCRFTVVVTSLISHRTHQRSVHDHCYSSR